MSRGVSTAADVVVFLALVSAAVATLSTVPAAGPDKRPDAGELVTVLTGTTATVEYETGADPNRTVRAHGTLAGLLASATVERARGEGTAVSPAGEPFGRAVARTVEDRLGPVADGWQVRLQWQPYPGAAIGGSMTVGETPPPDVPVTARTFAVGSGVVPARNPVAVAREDGYPGLASVLARALTRRFADGTGTLPAARGQAFDRIYGGDGSREAIAETVERRLRESTDDPVAAARTLGLSRVTVVVRRWSA